MTELIVFAAGIISGLVSGFIGGGGGLFTLPILFLTGLPAHTAIATARLGSLGLSIGALSRFFRSNAIKWKMVIPLTIVSIPAAIIGAYLVISIPQSYIEKIIGVILVLSAIAIIYKPKKQSPTEQKIGLVTYFTFFITRIAQAAFGSGIGLLVNVIYVKLMHMSMTEANATKRVPGFIVVIITLVIFGIEGLIDYQTGAILFAGTLIGSYTGAHIALSVGQKYVTFTFSAVAAIFGILLLF